MTALRNAVALAAALALLPISAQATVSRAVSFDDKVNNAASIILGKCVRQESRWDDAQRWILTYSTFEIERAIKGLPARQITIVTPGGSVGTIHQDTIGVPKFSVGNEHVVFVRNTAVGPSVLYFDQGAYEVAREGNERIVKPVVSAAVLVDSQRGMAVSPERPRTLREFEQSVRDTVRRKEALRMDMIERQKREEASLMNVLRRNKLLVLLALAGAVLATWQLVKRW